MMWTASPRAPNCAHAALIRVYDTGRVVSIRSNSSGELAVLLQCETCTDTPQKED